MRERCFWLTTADQFMVEIAAGLMAKHRSGKIDNPARSLLVSTLSKLGFGPTERSKLGGAFVNKGHSRRRTALRSVRKIGGDVYA
jgi:hypothetical protein